jgi:hypothetical protein
MAGYINEEFTIDLDNLPEICYNIVYCPITKKIEDEIGVEDKFGGDIPFFIEGESWPIHEEIPMTFFCQLKDPRKDDNILYRIFIAIDNDYECINHHITKIELKQENLQKQIKITKPEYNNDNELNEFNEIKELTKFPAYEITGWNTKNELKDCDSIFEILNIDPKKYSYYYNELREKFYDNNSYGIKVGGTPAFTQCADKEMYEKYNFLQLTDTSILPYGWGDSGIGHITEDCELYWDCC